MTTYKPILGWSTLYSGRAYADQVKIDISGISRELVQL